MSYDLGKIPPQATDVEQAIIGAVISEKDAIDQVADILKPDNFYRDSHKEIWRVIIHLYNKREPIDILTVKQQLEKSGKLDEVGGVVYLLDLSNKVNSSVNIGAHAKIVLEKSMKRDLINSSNEVQKMAYEETSDVFDVLGKAEKNISQIALNAVKKDASKLYDVYKKRIERIEELHRSDTSILGIPTGFTKLDRTLGGLQDTDMIVIAARPGMGKSALVMSILRNVAIESGYPVAIFSLEMSEGQLTDRLISSESEISSDRLRVGNLQDHEWKLLIEKTGRLSSAPVFIDDTPSLSIIELKAKARRLVNRHGVKLIAVDYLQLAKGYMDDKKSYNREQEISSISSGIKAIAKELNIPVIALSQLSRAVEIRGGDHKPKLSDLRESGSIEQDSDIVMFLYRPEYYGITKDENGFSTKGVAIIDVAKHRNGKTGETKLKWIANLTKFTDPDDADHITFRQIPTDSSDNKPF